MTVLWYFAYGKNVHLSEFAKRIEGAPLMVCRGLLPGYRLVFSKTPGPKPGAGYANIELCGGEWVEGVLYLITKEQLKKIDRYEGYPDHYTRSNVKVWNIDLKMWVNAVAYFAVNTDSRLKPSRDYVKVILEGAKLVGLSSEWIERLKRLLDEAI
ncbi:MAG: gamma-glutamylcyclotransferase [Thermoprotei archaeon]|nr:MAG: gamma-glutamylcyclotransferase [Thermoprotei archaeon]